MSYTEDQIRIALGIMSGRIDPKNDLRYFDHAKRLHLNLTSAAEGGAGNPGVTAHQLKAEEIVFSLLHKS